MLKKVISFTIRINVIQFPKDYFGFFKLSRVTNMFKSGSVSKQVYADIAY